MNTEELELFAVDPAWLRQAAHELEEPPASSAESGERDELVAELQEALRFDGERPAYALPDLGFVDVLETTGRRAYCEHRAGLEHVARMSTAELATRIEWVHKHRGRGLSELDLAVQKEWTARALGFGFFYGRAEPWLPPQLVELAGRRAPVRRCILAALCLSIVQRANGCTITAPEAQRLWAIAPSTWWSAIAWLEARGLLVRLRTYKRNDEHGPKAAPVQLDPNWYGPGPELVAVVDRVLAAFGATDAAAVEAEAARAHDELVAARKARARAQRERQRPQPGKPAPRWAMAVAAAAFAAAASTAANADAGRRLEAMRAGELAIADAIGVEPPAPPIDPELEHELEELATATPHAGPRELEAIAERIERRTRIATAPPAIAVQSADGVPMEPESRQIGSAHRSSAARSAAPSRARDDGDNVPSCAASPPATAGCEPMTTATTLRRDELVASRPPPATAGPPKRPRFAELVARARAAFGFGDDDGGAP